MRVQYKFCLTLKPEGTFGASLLAMVQVIKMSCFQVSRDDLIAKKRAGFLCVFFLKEDNW